MRILIFILSIAVCCSCNYLIKPKSKIVDNNFAAAIRRDCPLCIDKDNYLTQHADTLTVLNVDNGQSIVDTPFTITTLEGFNFKRLVEFSCSFNKITTLPNNLPKGLKKLTCAFNQITALPNNLPSSLEVLYCFHNKITAVPENLPFHLVDFRYSSNPIRALPANFPSHLEQWWCVDCKGLD